MARRNETSSMLGGDDEQPANQESGARSQESAAPPPAASPPPTDDERPGRPYCVTHNCLMRAASTAERVTYYKCPVPGCSQSAKKLRLAAKVPEQPRPCESSVCRAKAEPVYLEVVPSKSQLSKLWMQCPRCGFSVQQPRPAFLGPSKDKSDDLGAR